MVANNKFTAKQSERLRRLLPFGAQPYTLPVGELRAWRVLANLGYVRAEATTTAGVWRLTITTEGRRAISAEDLAYTNTPPCAVNGCATHATMYIKVEIAIRPYTERRAFCENHGQNMLAINARWRREPITPLETDHLG